MNWKTDHLLSSTMHSLADKRFYVVVVEGCCAAGTDELHRHEPEIIKMIYCHIMGSAEPQAIMQIN